MPWQASSYECGRYASESQLAISVMCNVVTHIIVWDVKADGRLVYIGCIVGAPGVPQCTVRLARSWPMRLT